MKIPVHDHMTHVVIIDILTGHEEKGNLHLIRKIIFHCIFIEKKHSFFSKLVQLILKVKHIILRNFVKIFISETMK